MPDIAQTYIELAFGLEGHLPGYIDGYFGPDEWKREDKRSLQDLEQSAYSLAEEVGQLENLERRTFLTAQVSAMQTSIRLLKGEAVPYAEEVRGLYDIDPLRVPESDFETAIAALGELLPGSGDIATREQELRAKLVVPADKVKDIADVIVSELKTRTLAKFPLPEDESFHLELVTNKPWGGYNWYLGDYRSRIDINTDLPTYLTNLPNLIAHEVYPGHHTEHALKEKLLWREQERLEHSILLINAPECVISEGVATWALEMVMSKDELRTWLADELAPFVGINSDDVRTMLSVMEVRDALEGLSGNAALKLYEDDASEAEVLRYFERYGLKKPEEAKKSLEFITYPTSRSYVFTYTVGYALLKPLLESKNADSWFTRLLQEPVTPGVVRDWVEKQRVEP